MALYDPERREVLVNESVQMVCEGEVVGVVHARYDLTEVADEFVENALAVLCQRPKITLGVMSRRQHLQHDRYYAARNAWRALPWWRRWRVPEPQYEDFVLNT